MSSSATAKDWGSLLIAVAALAVLQLFLRPLLPVDETRYLSVAWEMWQRGDFLVPYLNGEPYSHKPPLLFWMIHGLWSVFGVSEWSARLVFPLLSLLCLWATLRLARKLWPDAEHGMLAPWLLFGSLFWMNFYTLVQFDLLLVLAAVAGWCGMLDALRRPLRGWLLAAVAIGFGVLAKGPVILLPLLPALLAAPWWCRGQPPQSWWRWYAGGLSAVLLGAVIALAWAIPAGLSGGNAYREAIFWGQSAGRVVSSFAHSSPWWSYLWWLPLMWLPWLAWPVLWKALWRGRSTRDDGVRFCLWVSGLALLVFSLISGKQGKYLLPLFPLIAVLLAHALQQTTGSRERFRLRHVALLSGVAGAALAALPWFGSGDAWWQQVSLAWGLGLLVAGLAWLIPVAKNLVSAVRGAALGMLLLSAVLSLALVPVARPGFDLQRISGEIAAKQQAGESLAWLGKYHGQFHFLGRLQQRIEPLAPGQLADWLASHPGGGLLVNYKTRRPKLPAGLYVQPYRGGSLVVWPVQRLLDEPSWLDDLPGNA